MQENERPHVRGGASGVSKSDMARRISGSVSAKNNDEARRRDEARNREYRRGAQNAASGARPKRAAGAAARPAGAGGAAAKKRRPQRAKTAAQKNAIRAERELKRKKQTRRRLITGAVTFVVLVGLAAGGGLLWYRSGKAEYDGVFLENTYINGVRVAKMSVSEAAQVVRQYSDVPDVITIRRPDGVDVTIPLQDLDAEDNIEESVKDIYNGQDHNNWFRARTKDSNYSFNTEFDFDKDKFHSEIDRKIVEVKGSTKSKNARIERTTSGFQIIPEEVGTAIDKDKVQTLYDFIDGFLARDVYFIDLKNCNCYKLPKVTEADLRDEIGALESLPDLEFTYDFGFAKETLEGKEIMSWITFENDNPLDGYTVDEDKAYAYIDSLSQKYDTYGKDRKFHSTTRGDITVEQGEGCYGWWMDKDKMTWQLIDLIRDGISQPNIKPTYFTTEGDYSYTCNPDWYVSAEKDFSDTYCEVDLKEQHFWYYKDGKLKYDCDIVSGLPTAARNTPGGVYKLWYKEYDKLLVGSTSEGESWSTPVTYWNNISTFGVGLHDATWHPYFGGTRYTTDGSHGCINMPLEAAEYVYENIELNTPVFMYW